MVTRLFIIQLETNELLLTEKKEMIRLIIKQKE